MPVVRAADSQALADAFAVRRRVFVREQGISEDLEYDEYDECGGDPIASGIPTAETVHLVSYEDGEAVGTARLRPYETDDCVGKVERVAVLPDWRGEGVGCRLMAAVHDAAIEGGYRSLRLHAQARVRGFYESLGYRVTSDEPFEEAGIPHVAMERDLEK